MRTAVSNRSEMLKKIEIKDLFISFIALESGQTFRSGPLRKETNHFKGFALPREHFLI